MHPPRGTVAVAVAAGGGVGGGVATDAPPPPPKTLRQGWLKCRTGGEFDSGPAAVYEDFWCSLDSDGVLAFYREQPSGEGSGGGGPRLAVRLSDAWLEEHPAAAPGERGLAQLSWALRRRQRSRQRVGGKGDADGRQRSDAGAVADAYDKAGDGVVVRASSVRERAVWLASLSQYVAGAGGAGRRHQPRQLFAFMDDQGDNRAFRSLPRGALGAGRALAATTGALAAAATASLRRPWRTSLHSPPPPSPGDVRDADTAGAAAPVPAARTPPAGVRRRASLREVARRAREAAEKEGPHRLAWNAQPEVVEAKAAERLHGGRASSACASAEGRLRVESLRLWLALGEAQYNAELAPLAALARRCVSWLDPSTPAYARRTLSQLLEKVKRCSDGALNDMEQMWQKRLTFDGILGVLQKHMDKFDIFITYSSHLQELSNVFSGAKVKKTEVMTQAYSDLFKIERIYLPLVRLVAIRKILQEMRGLLEVTNLDHFQCKRTLNRITEVLDECYKVLATAYDSSFVSSLDKQLNDCCDDLVPVSFDEVIKKPEPAPRTTIFSNTNCENLLQTRPKAFSSDIDQQNVSARTSSSKKSPRLSKKSANTSKPQGLSDKINSVIGIKSSLIKDKPVGDVREDGIRTLPKRLKSNADVERSHSKSPEEEHVFFKKRSSLPKSSKKTLNSKAASSEKLVFNPQRISIVDIPLNDEYSQDTSQINKTVPHSLVEENPKKVQNNFVKEDQTETKNSSRKSKDHSELSRDFPTENELDNNKSSDIYEESTENSDHSGSSRSTLYGGSTHLSSSECTLNGDETSSNKSECENENSVNNPSSSKSVEVGENNGTLDHSYYELSMYYNNELYSSSDVQSGMRKQNNSDEVSEDNYDYVYVTDSECGESSCQCVKCRRSISHEHSPSSGEHISLGSDLTNESSTDFNNDYEDNIYETVQYVDMNSPNSIQDSETTLTQDSDLESGNIYDDIGIYVKPDLASLRSSSERSRYSSDSGTHDDASHTYYNSPSKCGSPLSSVEHPDDQQDDMHDETDSAIESGSDTGRLPKICRTPSNASISLHNMVRWRNAQPSTPLRPRRRTPRTPSLESPFDDAPLYQEYYMSSSSQSKEREIKPSPEEEKTYIYVEPKEHVYETLDDYLLSRDMKPITDTFSRRDRRGRSDSRRTQWCETEEVLEKGLLEGMSVEQRRLQEAKFEIITSEVSFLKSLNILEKYFINNKDLYTKETISDEDRRTLFLPIVPVKETSQWFLQDLVKVWEDNIILNNTQLGEVLLKYAKGRFRVYIAYCSRQVDINLVLAQLREKNRKFVEIIEKIEEIPICQAFSLQSFLTQPMQRITRFPMLVNAIIRQLPEDDESLPLWKNILSVLQAVVNECNEAVRNAERTLAQKREDKKKSFWTKLQGKKLMQH